jgi:pimeloyl-ACP methyl ester carboxylesterase
VKFAAAERALWDSFGVAPKEEWLDLSVTGTTVRALVAGEGPTLLFVHGASNAASSWVSLAAQLPDFRCVFLDRPGCGMSPKLAEPLTAVADLENFADVFLGEVVDLLGEKSVYLAATSFGGYFALRAAAATPSRFDKLVLLGWSVGAPAGRVPRMMLLGGDPRLGRMTSALKTPRSMVRPMLRQIGLRDAVDSGVFNDVMVDWFHALLSDTATMQSEVTRMPPIMTRRGMNAEVLLGDDVLGAVASPTLMLWGRDDPFGDEAIARAFAARVPSATLEMVRGGHAPWIDDAAGIAARVRVFLS